MKFTNYITALFLLISLAAPSMVIAQGESKKVKQKSAITFKDCLKITGSVALAGLIAAIGYKAYQRHYHPTASDRTNSFFSWAHDKKDDVAVAAGLQEPTLKQQTKSMLQDVKAGAKDFSQRAGNSFYSAMNAASNWFNKKRVNQ